MGGIFCDLEKVFDCVDQGILFSKLNCYNFYGIDGKDCPLYHSYMDNRYSRTAIYNDSGNINPLNAELNLICHLLALLGAHPILHISRIRVNKVSSWAKVRHGVPQDCVLGPLLFLLYIIDFLFDLPKITNRTSAPIIFADTSILFAHCNLIDCNKNIHIVF